MIEENNIKRTPKLNLVTTIGERLDGFIGNVSENFEHVKIFVDSLEQRIIELEKKVNNE